MKTTELPRDLYPRQPHLSQRKSFSSKHLR